jgi:hypothetical protein
MNRSIIGDLALLAAVGIGGYFLYSTIKKKADIGPGGGGAGYNPPKDSSTARITATEATAIATKQHTAMADLGTNEQLLFSSLNGLNGADLVKVFDAFGQKNYAATGSWFGTGYSLDLFGWYSEELDGSDLAKMRTIWAKSGLSLSF